MNTSKLETYILIALTIGLLIVACTAQNAVDRKFLAAMGVVVGTFTSANLSKDE
jgi:hypothetical protein